MPIGAITMILTNVGLQIYNNWCSSRQNKQLQQKREEFEQAARERNAQRMWQIMREGQELTRLLEEEKHQQRLEELKNDIGSLLQKLTYAATINNWPLNVLPFVMKNQALGNLLANQEESIALHCIFTPSNSLEFNRTVFLRIEEALEAYCNQHWSVMSDHPILFYSGAWKSQQAPSEVQIDSMRTALSNLPTLLITPFFRPNDDKLVFHVRLWGVGASSSDEFSIPEIEPTDFQRSYQKGDDYMNDADLMDELIEDLVPYLECMIGYMADTYFWSALGLSPCLPKLLVDGTINTDGMKYLVVETKDYFERLTKEEERSAIERPFSETKALSLYDGTACFYQDDSKKSKLEDIFISYCSQRTAKDYHSMPECLDVNNFAKEDLPFIREFRSLYQYDSYQKELEEIQSVLIAIDFDYSILESTDIAYLEKLANDDNGAAMFRLGEIYEFSIGVKCDEKLSERYYLQSLENKFILAEIQQPNENSIIQQKVILYLVNKGITQGFTTLFKSSKEKKVGINLLSLPKEIVLRHPFLEYISAIKLIEQKEIFDAGHLLQVSANSGYIKSQEKLLDIYKGLCGLPENPQLYFKYAEKAMLQNSPKATYALALCYVNGYGTQQSTSAGIMMIDKAVELGYSEAIRIKSLLNSL